MDANTSSRPDSARTFRDLADLLPEPTFCVTAAGVICAANAAAARLLRRPVQELAGTPLSDLVVEPPERVLDYLRRSAATRQWLPGGLTFRGERPQPYRADGALLASGGPDREPLVVVRCRTQGEAVGRFAELNRKLEELSREIARRIDAELEREAVLEREKLARRAAEEASRLKDEFLATVSHELRTPLNAIVGWAHLLQAGHLKPADTIRAMDAIARNAQAQARLIEDLLDVSRIASGKLRLQMGDVDLADVIDKAVESASLEAGKKRLAIEANVDRSGVVVHGDPDRLLQVVGNLVVNAVKFTPEGGHVMVRLARVDALALLTVADTGQGFSRDILPYLFDAFRQADGSSTRTHGGLGLGLAIAKELVEAHGGTIEATSPGPGGGAVFEVRLPLRAGMTVDQAERPGPAATVDLSGVRVLVVDDEADARELMTAVLEGHRAKVQTADSAAEALRALETGTADVLVADIGMADRDGYWLIRSIRDGEAATGGRLPALAVTAFASKRDRDTALVAGFDAHMAKPIDPPLLVEAVARLYARRGAGVRP